MFLGVGVGAFAAGFFHVFTHAFFKACLFLGAGSVIHAMHARIHDDDAGAGHPQHGRPAQVACRSRTGRSPRRPLAIIGFPFTSGFFSKDEILYRAFVDHTVNPLAGSGMLEGRRVFDAARRGSARPSTASASLAATMTAFYMCRALLPDVLGRLPRLDDRAPVAARAARARTATTTTTTTTSAPRTRTSTTPGYAAARVAVADDRAAHHPRGVLASSRASSTRASAS